MGKNNNNSDVLISQPIYLPSTPQDQLSWQQQQQIQQQQLQQQQSQQQQHQYQQQQQYMPVQGYTVGPLAQAPSIVPPQQQQQQHQHQSYQQQPVQMQQIQRSMVSPTIATPVAQPYYYQPGTGLVSVPLSLPSDNYAPQPFQPAQAVTVAPSALNHAHYPAPSVSAASASHVPPPPQQQQQQQAQQHHHQQQVQQHHHQQQQQVAYMPPPPPSATQTTVPTTTAAAPRAVTPESGSIFLPGDSSRLLLSQGLFKIVPDAEDEEEAQRAAVASTSQLGPSPDLGVDLHLGGDFLSSVLNYSSYQGSNGNNNTFKSFSQAEASNIPAATTNGTTVADPGANGVSQSQGQQARQQPGYHDRHAGEKDRPNNQPRYLVDKEEVIREHQGQQNGVTSTTATTTTATTTQQQSAEPVIVGSDIVLEPLPSVKAARKRGELTGGPDSTQSSSSSLLNSNNNQDSATALPQENPQVRKTQVLDRAPTLGEVLPTMGTEEYLERTDDKEEYSARLHGSREPSTSTVVHPARLGELSKEAQGGIVDIGTPITPNAILSVATATMPSPTAVRPSTPVRGVSTPPPLPLSTKPKFN
ncbi:hypothetical protein BGX33_006752 [Mortierella sp. NVP41]|nr:hypothetical protein BGX33_006752 [Mortierella sp. NVP41]